MSNKKDKEMLLEIRNFLGLTFDDISEQFNSFDEDHKNAIREAYSENIHLTLLANVSSNISNKIYAEYKLQDMFSRYFKFRTRSESDFINELVDKLDCKYSAEELSNIFKAEKNLVIKLANDKYAKILTPNHAYSIMRRNDRFESIKTSLKSDFFKGIK